MLDKKRLMEHVDGANVLIISPSNTYYVSGYESTFAYTLMTEDKDYYLTDSRYTFEASKFIRDMEIVECGPSNVYDIILDLADKDRPLYYDTEISYEEFLNIMDYLDDYIEVRELDDIIHEMRYIKSDEEIANIVKAQNIAEKSLEKLLPCVKEGMTELEVVAILEYFMKSMGGDRLSFDTIVAFGVNGASPHAHPGNTKLNRGDFITIDFGTTVKGYHGDMTRTMAFGNPTAKMRKVYEIVKDAQRMGIENIMAGKKCSDIDAIARNYIASKGYGDCFGHGLGHSVGIDIHEDPRLSPSYDGVLSVNNVITCEPGIYIPNEFGLRIEDIIIVKDNNQIDINNLTRELIIL